VDLGKILGSDYLPALTINVIDIIKQPQSTYLQFPNATFSSIQGPRRVQAVASRFDECRRDSSP
jgi:hypothetical protein